MSTVSHAPCRAVASLLKLVVALQLVALLLVGCGADGVVSGEPIDIVDVYNGFGYYGACGNETVKAGGAVYYPLFEEERVSIDTSRYPTDLSEQGLVSLQRVVDPGPGDDVGTLLVYEDGTARFESDSGRLLWLSDEQRTYNWVC